MSSVSPASFLSSHREMFIGLRIPAALYEPCAVGVDNWEARHRYDIRWSPSADLSGLMFLYFSPVTGYRVGCRLRLDVPVMSSRDDKPIRYLCPPDSHHFFFPPGAAEMLKDPATIIALVEAEKSALAMTAFFMHMGWDNWVAIAMGGCWGWHSKRARSWLAPNGSWERVPGPLDDLKYCNGHKVYILLDSNTATNPDVERARVALVVELNKANRNCTVLVCDLPIVAECED